MRKIHQMADNAVGRSFCTSVHPWLPIPVCYR